MPDLVHVDPDAIVLHHVVEGLQLIVPVTLKISYIHLFKIVRKYM